MLELIKVSKSDIRLKQLMSVHYTKPKGFVGRSICYLIFYDNDLYGAITGNSPILHLANRFTWLYNNFRIGMYLDHIVNNQFYHLTRINNKYPIHNFALAVLKLFKNRISIDWKYKYNYRILFFETLVEPPRTGSIYTRDHWSYLGMTKGYTCKRIGGDTTDSFSGKRFWNTNELRPKHIFMARNCNEQIPNNLLQKPLFCIKG